MAAAPVRQLTLGGEYASGKLLEQCRAVWPRARITHVYATTEAGDICAVSDGHEGLPVAKLVDHRLTEEGELVVDGYATGDLWERRGERLHFLGRREDIINVGGAKVAPSLVEAACLELPQVTHCRAYAVKSALLGQVVGLDYVGTLEAGELRTLLRASLPRHAVPATVNRLAALPMTAAGKTSRGLQP
jgi:acyl-coenzyme A synthetase/AMP-(fatty) acid ligase